MSLLQSSAPARLFVSPRPGHGQCTAHHGELFQGQIEDGDRRRRRCLVSLPCYGLLTSACFVPDDSGRVRVEPASKIKAGRVVRIALAALGLPDAGGTLTLLGNISEGKGYGSSTADCVAAARAVARAFGHVFPPAQLAQIVVSAEVASDNVMFHGAVLFAQREGTVIEDYGRAFPDLEVLGIDTNPPGIVDTLVYPPADYSPRQVQQFHVLVTALRRALETDDVHLLGTVATASARINELFLAKPLFGEVSRLVRGAQGLGVAVAHSGTILSLLLDPRDPRLESRVEFLLTHLQALGVSRVLRFRTIREQPLVTGVDLASPAVLAPSACANEILSVGKETP